jgi:hypothetical protein
VSNRQIIKLLKQIEKNTRPAGGEIETTHVHINNPDYETTLRVLGDRYGILSGPQIESDVRAPVESRTEVPLFGDTDSIHDPYDPKDNLD